MRSHLLLIITVCIQLSCNPLDPSLGKDSIVGVKNGADSKAPNIVFLFTDDQTYTAIHALGNDGIITPNLDRLVNGGTTFTHAYNMGAWNGAVCAASRAMMISGRSVWRVDQFRQRWKDGDAEALGQTWPKLMEGAGYDTYMTGKWHVDAPADDIFQHATHIRPGMPRDKWNHNEIMRRFKEEVDQGKITAAEVMPIGYNRPLSPDDDSWSPIDTSFGGFWEGGKHWSEVLKDDAINYIHMAEKSTNPFFMYLAFNAPHDPRQAPQEYLDMYPLEDITLPESWLPQYPYKDDIGNGPSLRDEALAPFPRTVYAVKKHIQEYYALITHLDHQIGKILDALEATGQMENTYIFMTADHGLAVGKHGLLGKQNMYDHSVRVPLMMMGPDIPKGERRSADVYLQDIMATSLDLAGIEKPKYIEFNSLLGLAKDEAQQGNYKSVYCGYIDQQRMIRKDGFKLIYYPNIKRIRLFDLKADPEEIDDIVSLPNHQGRIETMWNELQGKAKHLEDPLELPELPMIITD